MKLNQVQMTDVVEVPAIVCGSRVDVFKPELLKLDTETLSNIAKAYGGKLLYLKVEVVYMAPITNDKGEECTQFCTSKGCWELSIEDHPLGRCENHKDNG